MKLHVLPILINPCLIHSVRLGNSGLKVSQIILGCMSYGSPEWQKWVLPEEEAIKHIKAASVIYKDSYFGFESDPFFFFDTKL